tara:strand:+ start:35821 stop:36975 length:1155 start_codon:yes stop_codon:yes gene_type:complete
LKRALKFFLVFLAAASFIFAIVIGFNYSAFKTLFANNDGMRDGYEYIESTYSLKALAEFIGDHPEYMSVVSFNVNDPDSGIYYNADVPRTMGTLANVFLILEYERQVESGELNPNEILEDIDEIERFSLPEISEESHRKSYELLGVEEKSPITVDQLVSVMVETNDLAIADYLWFKLGGQNIQSLIDSLNLSSTDTPLPFSGLYLSIHPDVIDTSLYISRADVIALAERLNTEPDFVRETKELFDDVRLDLSFIEERNALAHFPHTTSREIAGLMAKLHNNELISPEVSIRVKEKMKWVFEGEAIKRSFSEYGAIYDNRMGMLSGIDFGTSAYDGHTSAQAVFFDKLPVAFWLHLSANHMQEDYQQRLIWDPALYETTIKEISK